MTTNHKPSLLIAHAAGFHGYMYRTIAKEFSITYGPSTPDLTGHGKNPEKSPLENWDVFTTDILEFSSTRNKEPLFGFGHSLGGSALLFAEHSCPGTFTALALYEPILFPPDLPKECILQRDAMIEGTKKRRQHFSTRSEAMENFASKNPMKNFARNILCDYVEGGFKDDSDGISLRCTPTFEASIYATATASNIWNNLYNITCPVLIMTGKETPHSPSHFARHAVSLLPNSEHQSFDDLDHFGPFVRPQSVAKQATDYFQDFL
jgi:pimeloyl-ACP methyl ester carboxylesterase